MIDPTSAVELQIQIVAQMADVVVVVAPDLTITHWNAEAEKLYGVPAVEAIGRQVDDVFQVLWRDEEERQSVYHAMSTVHFWRGEVAHQRPDGKVIEVEVALRYLRDSAGNSLGTLGVIRDITERKRMEAELKRQRAFSEALRYTASELTRTLNPEYLMRLIVDQACQFVTCEYANIMLIDGDTARFAYARGYSDSVIETSRSFRIPLTNPVLAYMLSTGQALRIEDTYESALWKRFPELESNTRSYLGVPIHAYGQVVGFLSLDDSKPNVFTVHDEEYLRAFAAQAAIAVENAQLYESILRDTAEMRALYRATTFLLNSELFAGDDLATVGGVIAQTVVRELGKLDCGVMMLENETGRILWLARAGDLNIQPRADLFVHGKGLVPEAIRSGTIIYAPDVEADERYIRNDLRTRSELVVPLRTVSGVIGALDLQSASLDAFSAQDQRLLQAFADRAASALQNIQLFRQVRSQAERLEALVSERTAQLERTSNDVRAILENVRDGIMILTLDGAITQTNAACDDLFASETGGLVGRAFEQLIEPNARERFQHAARDVAATQQPARLEVSALRDDGGLFDADIWMSAIRSGTTAPTRLIASLRDITDRKRNELELRAALDREQESNSLKSRFVAQASHEFRTPLAMIQSASDLLHRYGERMTPAQREQKIMQIQTEVQHLTLLLQDLLTIGQVDKLPQAAFNPVMTDVNELFVRVCLEIQQSIGVGHRIELEQVGRVWAFIDPKLIRQMLVNLLTNAVKYSPSRSIIRVTLAVEKHQIVIRVIDHGVGIPPTAHTRIFDPFYRAANVDDLPGTGLGLSIVKQAVDLHRGSIQVASDVGSGTTFEITLPLLEESLL